MLIDSHTHVFPNPLEGSRLDAPVERARRATRKGLARVRRSLHGLQPLLRHIPGKMRAHTDRLAYGSLAASLLVEGTARDLLETMAVNRVARAVVIAAPPVSSNEFVLGLAAAHPGKLVPVVNLPPGDDTSLESLVGRGAAGLKIHAAVDGEPADSKHYARLLAQASELKLPVILHTGCLHMKLVYRDPEMGRAEKFAPWFEAFPRVKFILAHMNFHEPEVAVDLALRHPNVALETSWQPPAVIQKAVRVLGPERILFGTDWPLVGDNMTIGLKRIDACLGRGLDARGAELVLGGNAARIFNLSSDKRG